MCPHRADQLRGLELVEVTDPAQRGIWNELMRSEHPRGAVQHAGAQLRYLLVSDHGVLGALGFAAAAPHAGRSRHLPSAGTPTSAPASCTG